ncbi:MAG: methyltransferase [Bacteroidales bacterium]
MANHYFRFKQFEINQEHCAMKVGTDGVLLGAWCDVSNASRILDIGTGTGLISLMIAQRNATAQIDAVEIDEDAFKQASFNFAASPWSCRLHPIKCSFTDFEFRKEQKYDLIVSNPPYFEDSLKADCKKRTMARHTDSLSFDSLIQGASALLAENGILSLVYPVDADVRINALASGNGLVCVRKTWVKGNPASPVKRVLAEFVHSSQETALKEEELVVEVDRHVYTSEYTRLTRDFYLKMK